MDSVVDASEVAIQDTEVFVVPMNCSDGEDEVRFNIQSLTSTTLIEPSLDKDKYKKAFPPRDMWKEYLSWRGNSKTKHEERTVVYSFWKNDFFKTLEKNTWVVGDDPIQQNEINAQRLDDRGILMEDGSMDVPNCTYPITDPSKSKILL
uniref:Ulp1-like peptidase n=1 Tax=Cucumis melo TaxID=3656 RepID=A0A9I9E4Y0_CUCME